MSKMDEAKENIPHSIQDLTNRLNEYFDKSMDFVTRDIFIGKYAHHKIIIAFIDGLVDKQLINSDVVQPLVLHGNDIDTDDKNWMTLLQMHYLSSCNIKKTPDLNHVVDAILSGETALFADNEEEAIIISLPKWDKRSIEESPSDAVVRGPREGFTETLSTNISLLRRKIKNTNLKFEPYKLGEQTNTNICISYIQGIVNEDLLNNVREKIKHIKTDAILESGYIEEFIEKSPFTIFPTVGNTEKPDIAASKLLEGRIAILSDGTPFVLTVPYLLVEVLQSSEDYYSRSIYSVITRFLRILAILITSLLPAYYVALVSFHQDVIPYKLLLTMTASKEGIPFSALAEALIMIVTFELLREAGVRMPRAIGQAISIVGALVIGDAAVKAGLISTPMVIVIAITAITGFIVFPLVNAFLIIRIATTLAASVIGILGILLVSVGFFIHLCSLDSFGVNYLSPFTPLSSSDMKDTFVRFPIWAMFTRPKTLTWEHGGRAKYRNRPFKKGMK